MQKTRDKSRGSNFEREEGLVNIISCITYVQLPWSVTG